MAGAMAQPMQALPLAHPWGQQVWLLGVQAGLGLLWQRTAT